jgi:hypothetical protein
VNARFITLSFSLCAVTAMACGGSSKNESAPSSPAAGQLASSVSGAPAWATGDCRKYFGEQPVICGVGSVSGVTSPTLARNAAMGRGRTEIARYLQVRVKSILTDFQKVNGGLNEQSIEENSKQITDLTLSGTRMTDYWIAPDGTYYALMSLGLEEFKSSVEQAPNIQEPLRQAVLQAAGKAFSVHDDETSRY